jgi:hypothetical protein
MRKPVNHATCAHEGGHATGLLLIGVVPSEVRADRPEVGTAGVTTADPGASRSGT